MHLEHHRPWPRLVEPYSDWHDGAPAVARVAGTHGGGQDAGYRRDRTVEDEFAEYAVACQGIGRQAPVAAIAIAICRTAATPPLNATRSRSV